MLCIGLCQDIGSNCLAILFLAILDEALEVVADDLFEGRCTFVDKSSLKRA